MTRFAYHHRCMGYFFVVLFMSMLSLSCHSSLKVHYLHPSTPVKSIHWFNYCLNNITLFQTFRKVQDVLSGEMLDEFYAIENLIIHNLSRIESKSSSSSSSQKNSVALYTPKNPTSSESQKAKFLYFKKDIKLFIAQAKNFKIQILKLDESQKQSGNVYVLAYFYYESGIKPESNRINLVYENETWKIKSIQPISETITKDLWPKN